MDTWLSWPRSSESSRTSATCSASSRAARLLKRRDQAMLQISIRTRDISFILILSHDHTFPLSLWHVA